jgi:VWFA-related protein
MTNKLPVIAGCVVALLPVVQQQPVFRGRVDLVAVDVHVVDGSGRQVADLRAEDFTLKVDGKPRPIVAAEYISHGVSSASVPARSTAARRGPLFSSNASPSSGAPGRTLLLVVDESNIGAGNGHWAMMAAERFLDQMGPADRVGLALIPYGRANIDPTTDHAEVREALQHIIGHLHTVQPESSHSLGLVEAFAFANDDGRTWQEAIQRECYAPRFPETTEICVKLLETDARRMVSDAHQRLLESVRSFVALLTALTQLPGPKTLVLISEELPVSPYLADRTDFSAEASQIAAAAARAEASVYVLQLHTPLVDVETRLAPPTSTEDADIRASGLEHVTSLTGGTRLMISGQPGAAFDRIALEISGYYLLGFRAEAADRDGQPHDIAVEVRRPGIHVRARKMFAFGDVTKASPDANATDVVNRLLRTPAEAADLPLAVATYALPAPGQDPPRVQVIISAEIGRAVKDAAAVTVGYILLDATGKNAGASVEQVTLKPVRAQPGGPLGYLAAAIVPPGRYTMRFAAADDALRAGSVEHRVEARLTEVGELRISDLIIHDPHLTEPGGARPSVLAALRDTLAASLELASQMPELPPGITVRLEVAGSLDGPALAGGEMALQPSPKERRFQASGSVPLSGIPPGDYVGRAVVSFAGGAPAVRVTRPVRIMEPSVPAVLPGTPAPPSAGIPPAAAQPQPAAAPTVAAATPPATPPVAAATPAIARAAPARTVEEAVERAGRYIVDYGGQMSLVIGIERYAQWMQREDFIRPVTRQLVSEFALVRVKDDWLGFRDVYEVDGKPVSDRQDRLEKLFLQSPSAAVDQGRQIAQESARYNMGAIQRNFNVPTTALFFLQPANLARFRFRKSGEDSIDGVPVWKVGYEETRKPTIIRTSAGKDMPLKGTMWIDPTDGRVLKTHMEIISEARLSGARPSSDPGGFGDLQSSPQRRGAGDVRRVNTSASITVTYRLEPKFGLLVPSVMLETYEGPTLSQFTGEESVTKINCRATYSDFKRFETSGRVVIPK